MLNVLLVRIEPRDKHIVGLNLFSDADQDDKNFKVSVTNGKSLEFTVYRVSYSDPHVLKKKASEIDKALGIKCGGHVIAIDQYPSSHFEKGAEKVDHTNTSLYRYEVKCSSEDFKYDSVVLLSPNSEPIILSNLDFACYYPKGFCSSLIAFFSDSAISVPSQFGETVGIPLKTHCEDALESNHSDLFYTMSFEKVSLPAVILQKLLESKPQADIPSDTSDVV